MCTKNYEYCVAVTCDRFFSTRDRVCGSTTWRNWPRAPGRTVSFAKWFSDTFSNRTPAPASAVLEAWACNTCPCCRAVLFPFAWSSHTTRFETIIYQSKRTNNTVKQNTIRRLKSKWAWATRMTKSTFRYFDVSDVFLRRFIETPK